MRSATDEPESLLRGTDSIDVAVDRFRTVFTKVKTQFKDGQARSGLAASEIWVLSMAAEAKDGMTVGELAAALAIHQSTTSNLLRPLAERGLVAMTRSPQDRRLVRVQVTPAGRRALRKAPAPFAGVLTEALRKVDASVVRRLERDLAVLVAALDN